MYYSLAELLQSRYNEYVAMIKVPENLTNAAGDPLRVLFLAPYAPDAPDYATKPYQGNGGYPQYHHSIYRLLIQIGCQVESSSKPYAILHARGNVDYVFSLLNRFPIENPEIFISSYCEFAGVPYLGAAPNIRAIAEDKWLLKLTFRGLGLPVARGIMIRKDSPVPTVIPDELAGVSRFFVKKRFGAASDCITEENVAPTWGAATARARSIMSLGHDVLIEEFCPGIDYTVPILGGEQPTLLGFVRPGSDKKEGIITGDLKLHDHLGYAWAEDELSPEIQQGIREDMRTLWNALAPIDYFRLDYRIDPVTGSRKLIEMNICCYIGKSGPFAMGAQRMGYTHGDLMKSILHYSYTRQINACAKHACLL